MKNTRSVVGVPASGHAAMPGGASRQTFSSTMAAQIEFPNDRRRKDEYTDCRGTALWRSVFMFFMEGFAAYGASMHPTVAFSVETALTAAGYPHPWPASRTPIATEHARGPYLISETRNVVGPERVATSPASQADGIG
jgi:hypothetical protein